MCCRPRLHCVDEGLRELDGNFALLVFGCVHTSIIPYQEMRDKGVVIFASSHGRLTAWVETQRLAAG